MRVNGDDVVYDLMEEVDRYFEVRKKLDNAFSKVYFAVL